MNGFKARDAVLLGAGAVIALLLFGAPFATLGPLLLIGGCLLMHVFMMRGMSHGGHDDHDDHDDLRTPPRAVGR